MLENCLKPAGVQKWIYRCIVWIFLGLQAITAVNSARLRTNLERRGLAPAPVWVVRREASGRGGYGRETFAVVIDAGSTSSRSRIYRWSEDSRDGGVPDITEVNSGKIVSDKGVSAVAHNPRALELHVAQLITRSVPFVPEKLRARSSIYFMATAG